jgi:hypothetical protein
MLFLAGWFLRTLAAPKQKPNVAVTTAELGSKGTGVAAAVNCVVVLLTL